MTAQSVAPRRTIMKTFTIDSDNSITAFATQEEAAATTTTPFDSFASQKDLAELAAGWPAERLVAIWNSLPGVKPVKSFKNAKAGASRIWECIQGLGDAPKAEAKPASRRPTRRPRAAHRPPRARPPGPGRPTRPPPQRTRPRARRPPRAKKVSGRARAARRPRWSPCSNARTALRWLRSWTRWDQRACIHQTIPLYSIEYG